MSANTDRTRVEVRLHKEVSINSKQIYLGDIGTVYSNRFDDFSKLSKLLIATVPSDQSSFQIPKGYLEQRIRSEVSSNVDMVLDIPESVIVKLAGIESIYPQVQQRILELVHKNNPANIKFTVEPANKSYQIDKELSLVSVDPVVKKSQLKGLEKFKIIVKQKDGSLKTLWVDFNIRWAAEVYVANENIRLGSKISEENFSTEMRDITEEKYIPILKSEVSVSDLFLKAKLTKSIRKGDPLASQNMDKIPDLKIGERLKVIFISDSGLQVSTEGVLLSNASIGDQARVKLKTTRRTIVGKVVDKGLMEVSL
ncbi:MAG: flagellar basal body P-ring formation chaperone FlgA [Oligoflexia bacterium]|nr:flagellar basal body P-ring formation chaperone FlgA [Oligoflexia bacterium]